MSTDAASPGAGPATDAASPSAGTSAALARLRRALAARTGTDAADWYPVFKARQGMRVAFDVLAAERPGRPEVATQLFTCCTAVDPIVSAGLTPVYGDISARTLALDTDRLPIGGRTAAVVLQHTFGIHDAAADASLRDAAHSAGALVLEDCAHCVGRLARDAAGVPLADISVHSFGVEKLLPTFFGGAVWLNPRLGDEAVRSRLAARLSALPMLEPARARAVRRYRTQIRVLNHLSSALSHALRERLVCSGRFEPAVAPIELAGGLASEPAVPDAWIAERAVAALDALDANEAQRRAAVAAYATAFADVASEPGVDEPGAEKSWACAGGLADAQPLLRVGVFVPGPGRSDAAVRRLRDAGLYAVPWYRPLLFPGVSDEARYGLSGGLAAALTGLPVTRACSEGAVCLPTDVEPDVARRAVALALERG